MNLFYYVLKDNSFYVLFFLRTSNGLRRYLLDLEMVFIWYHLSLKHENCKVMNAFYIFISVRGAYVYVIHSTLYEKKVHI